MSSDGRMTSAVCPEPGVLRVVSRTVPLSPPEIFPVWLLISLGRRWLGGRTGELAAVIFLVLADPGIQRLGGLNVRAQCETFIGAAIAGAILLAGNPARRRSGWIAAGVLLAAAFWLKYNALAYAAPVLAAAALAEPRATPLAGRLTSVRWIAAGFAMPALAVVLWFVASGAFADLWLATIRYNMAYSGETYGGVFDFVRYVFTFPVAHARVDGLWFVGLLGALVIVASAVRRNLRESLVPILWLAAAIAAIAINGSRSLPQYFVQAWPADDDDHSGDASAGTMVSSPRSAARNGVSICDASPMITIDSSAGRM